MQTGSGAVVLDVAGFDALLRHLGRDRRLLGPVLADGEIGIGEITGVGDLPAGWTDEQAPGRYRAVPRADGALFGYAVGQRSWRTEVNPSRVTLVHIRRHGSGPEASQEVVPADPDQDLGPTAWIGVRGCDLAALAITDRVLLGGTHPDPHYAARRRQPFLVAVDCTSPSATCFCTSMGTGPEATGPDHPGPTADLHVHERCDDDRHEFLCRAGTAAGRALLDAVATDVASAGCRPADPADLAAASAAVDTSAATIDRSRTLDTDGLAARLEAALDHPRWDDVAERCLSCSSCTLVCPTCFCSTVEATTDLAGTEATHTRVADSCFTLDHSHLHGGSVHASTRSRYRQWLTHKLDTWHDQFGTAGCVGCGRCITWCPVGIDLTVEAAAIAGPPSAAPIPTAAVSR